jgi:transposase
MDMRELKALELAARAKITWTDGAWLVPSQSGNTPYRVTTWPGAEACTCDDFALRQSPCKHIIAAKLIEERDGKRQAPPIDTDTLPERKTYKQNWPLYNLAQSVEKHRLQVLLADPCRGIPSPRYAGTGRHARPVSDRLFAAVFKTYCDVSYRRFACDLDDAIAAGHLSMPMHYNKVSQFLESPAITPHLRELVTWSSLPLAGVETEFAVDSTGFSVSRHVRWHDEKYGVTRSGKDWVKVHICTGVKTNVVTAVEIHGRDAADCPLLPPLVTATAEHFTVKEVSADRAYLSAENVEAVAAVGGAPFIAPKSNTTGLAGGLFERMYHYYAFNREDFLRHYHKRSNVESTFSAIKRKFGSNVRARTDAAMRNDVLCKVICQNLTRTIRSQIELGIAPVFWPDDGGPRDVLPMAAGGTIRPGGSVTF